MAGQGDPDLVALGKLSGELAAALRSIADDQRSLATACSDWDVTALVDHVTGGNWFTKWIFDGLSADQAMNRTVGQFGGGSATNAQAASSVGELVTIFTRPGVLDERWSHVVGDLTGRQILRLRLHDLIVHLWDIQQTIDAPAVLQNDLVTWGLDELADDTSLASKHFELQSIPMPKSCENATTAYLGMFGR